MNEIQAIYSIAPFPQTVSERAHRFLTSPPGVKWLLIARRFKRWFPGLPLPVQLRFGAWWLIRGGALDSGILSGGFENPEARFVRRFLKPGMVVVDAGAHHGLYTLLGSICVGELGVVFAFEPSPRERIRLREHVRLNGCSNVRIESLALGPSRREEDMFLVEGSEDYCNSLRPPVVQAGTTRVRVNVTSLDDFFCHGERVDFVKLDVEGAELGVLQGAQRLLSAKPRPVLLVEVFDIRTQPWGYHAREIVSSLAVKEYCWFGLLDDGGLTKVSPDLQRYDCNLVAIPNERVSEVINHG